MNFLGEAFYEKKIVDMDPRKQDQTVHRSDVVKNKEKDKQTF